MAGAKRRKSKSSVPFPPLQMILPRLRALSTLTRMEKQLFFAKARMDSPACREICRPSVSRPCAKTRHPCNGAPISKRTSRSRRTPFRESHNMLAGATQRSDSDPYDKTSPPITVGPHWMIMWPFDPKASGLPTTHRDKGAYIMWAGSSYAHLHVMGHPDGSGNQ